MHVDPSVHVLASSTLMGGWLPASGVEMPAAYVRTEGKGRVFYVARRALPEGPSSRSG